MKTKSLLCLALAAAVFLCFVGCSAKSEISNEYRTESPSYGAVMDSAELTYGDKYTGSSNPGTGVKPQGQKLIRTMNMDVQTQEMDALLSWLDSRVHGMGGYVENRNVYNGTGDGSRRTRSARLTIRIPAASMDEFAEHIGSESNVVSMSENTDDITLTYVATESRITALEVEQKRLLELLEKADNMADLLQIEARLTAVRTELEEVTSVLRVYDNLVDYGTMNLSITEVREYIVVEEEQSVWQRIGTGLSENWNALCEGATNFFVFLVVSLPYLIPLTAIVTALIVLLRVRRKNRVQKNVSPAEDETQA